MKKKQPSAGNKSSQKSKTQCITYRKDSKILVEEGKRKVIFVNDKKEPYEIAKVDGCLLQNTTASDYVVSKLSQKPGNPAIGHVVVELKGKDVDHAVEQIKITMSYWRAEGRITAKIAGLVICARYPRIDTKIQRFKTELATSYRAPLHIMSSNPELHFERVLDFKGPY